MESSSLLDPELSWHSRWWHRVPALRRDLRAVRSNDSPMCRLHDPRTGKFVELYEPEYRVARAMDGKRSGDDLTALARLGNPAVTSDQIRALVVQLLQLGALEEDPITLDDAPIVPGHGKVIPLPTATSSADEFSAF